jgi:uncharacterized protein YdcH (DUF465 family)
MNFDLNEKKDCVNMPVTSVIFCEQFFDIFGVKSNQKVHQDLKGVTCPMDTSTMNSLRDTLLKNDPVFRQLATEHKKYESRLDELSSLHYPSDEEQLEETVLKKKKLAVKDQMYAMLLSHEHSDQITH